MPVGRRNRCTTLGIDIANLLWDNVKRRFGTISSSRFTNQPRTATGP